MTRIIMTASRKDAMRPAVCVRERERCAGCGEQQIYFLMAEVRECLSRGVTFSGDLKDE